MMARLPVAVRLQRNRQLRRQARRAVREGEEPAPVVMHYEPHQDPPPVEPRKARRRRARRKQQRILEVQRLWSLRW